MPFVDLTNWDFEYHLKSFSGNDRKQTNGWNLDWNHFQKMHQMILIIVTQSAVSQPMPKRLSSSCNHASSWLTRQESHESAFQCSDDVYDAKIRGNSIVCGLRNGTIEIWNILTLKKEMELLEQHGSVQVKEIV